MTSAADYINEYVARRAPMDMVAPWRHRNLLVRALWHKQAYWLACDELEGCAKPSHEWDVAFDAMKDAGKKYETAVREALTNRQLDRLADSYANQNSSLSEHVETSNEKVLVS